MPWLEATQLPRGCPRSMKAQCGIRAMSTCSCDVANLPAVAATLEGASFVADELLGVVMFRDGPEGKPGEAVHLLFSGEKTRAEHLLPAPEIETVDDSADFRVIRLQSLVVMKLVSNKSIDYVHIRDLVDVGLIDTSWLCKLPPQLAERLQHILDTPDG